jgi:hypothetical protein
MVHSEAPLGAASRASVRRITTIAVLCALSASSAAPLASPSGSRRSTVATGFHDRTPRREGLPLAAHPAALQEGAERWQAKGSSDLFGNEISDAVARYTLDETGALYEVHSPETELPRLTSPVG